MAHKGGNMKKVKYLILIIMTLILFMLTSCGDSNESKKTSSDNVVDVKPNISFENKMVTYSGILYEHKISGDLPKDVLVTYDYSNLKVKPGNYTVYANFINGEKYGLKKLAASITIIPYSLISSNIKFNDNFEFDGESHSLELLTELPKHISLVYENNSRTEIGEQEVKISYKIDKGYEDCFLNSKPFTRTLTISNKNNKGTVSDLILDYNSLVTSISNPNDLELSKLKVYIKDINGNITLTNDYLVTIYFNNSVVNEINEYGKYIYKITYSKNINLYKEFEITYEANTQKLIIDYSKFNNGSLIINDLSNANLNDLIIYYNDGKNKTVITNYKIEIFFKVESLEIPTSVINAEGDYIVKISYNNLISMLNIRYIK